MKIEPIIDKRSIIKYRRVMTSKGFYLRESSGQPESKLPSLNCIIHGDARTQLKNYPENFFDLIVTSPPYADNRKHTYGGVHPDNYVGWFLQFSHEFLRVLKPTGSFILNIKEKVMEGQRHTYVLELILEMKRQGWIWTEEYIWHKKNCYPGKWPNRFRDAWERCLHFTGLLLFEWVN